MPFDLHTIQQSVVNNWQGLLFVWLGTTLLFWFMGGFTPAIAGPPMRTRRQLVVGGPHTREDVATHNTEEDCWIIVTDKADDITKVYDVTDYIDFHPGGYAIMRNAGKDSTKGFYGPQHPITTRDVICEYYIGPLAIDSKE